MLSQLPAAPRQCGLSRRRLIFRSLLFLFFFVSVCLSCAHIYKCIHIQPLHAGSVKGLEILSKCCCPGTSSHSHLSVAFLKSIVLLSDRVIFWHLWLSLPWCVPLFPYFSFGIGGQGISPSPVPAKESGTH